MASRKTDWMGKTTKTPLITPTPAERLLRPFQEFARQEASGGIILIICMVIALFWANSPLVSSYHNLWQTKLTIGIGAFVLAKPLLLWINDGLMAVFFFVVGLEIKRELLVGELSSFRQAILPVAAAIGGMAMPAFAFILLNRNSPGVVGWGIPMATDIAFALGILALLGRRAPTSLKVFLTALAIVDDIGAVLVIALFYTGEIAWGWLAIAAGILFLLIVANRLGVRHLLVYGILGIGLWVAFLKSGVHATIAGVLLATTIPSKARIDVQGFITHCFAILNDLERANAEQRDNIETQQATFQALETMMQHAETPLQRLEHALHPWVAYFIMPIFALANAGVTLGNGMSSAFTHPVGLGIAAGLVLGKQLGITLSVWLIVKSKLANLPGGVTWRQIYGASWLAGIGFTMSLFIAGLAFGDTSLLSVAKVGILMASLIAAGGGLAILGSAQPGPN